MMQAPIVEKVGKAARVERPTLPQERNSAKEGKIDNEDSYPARQNKFDLQDNTQRGNATSEPIITKVRTSWR